MNHFQPGASLSASGNTSVVFATNGATNVDFGVINPGQFCQADPTMGVNCYLKGPQSNFPNPGEDVLVSFPYNAGCADEDQNGVCDAGSADTPTPTELSVGADLGTTWGLAYQRSSDTLFAASFQKRHSGFRTYGDTGVIYRVDDASQGTPTTAVSVYVDFDALGIPTADAAAYPPNGDPHPAPVDTCTSALADGDAGSTNRNCWLHDTDSYGAGGSHVVRRPRHLGRRVDPVDGQPVRQDPLLDSGADDAGRRSRTSTASRCRRRPATASCQPFAVGVEDGLVFVGMVCDGSTDGGSAGLRLLVRPGQRPRGFTQRLSEPLNYGRGLVVNSGGANIPAAWQPWSDDSAPTSLGPVFGTERGYPQPVLTDIEFDDDDLMLGIRDRFADSRGSTTALRTTRRRPCGAVTAAGDILRACPSGSNWTFESNASCGGVDDGRRRQWRRARAAASTTSRSA